MAPDMNEAIFHQDDASPHYANPAKQLLRDSLYERWIGRGNCF